MDNLKFGIFLAQCRKDKGWTQKDLAERLNVTDKAVSKWERGLGFPDIKLIEPLAGLLEVTVLELMRSEYIEEEQRPSDCGPEVASGMADLAALQQKVDRRNTAIAVILTAAALCMIFLVDLIEGFEFFGFAMMMIPILCIGIGLVLLFLSWLRFRTDRPCHKLLLWSFLLMGMPVALTFAAFLLLLLSLKMGVEVPW